MRPARLSGYHTGEADPREHSNIPASKITSTKLMRLRMSPLEYSVRPL